MADSQEILFQDNERKVNANELVRAANNSIQDYLDQKNWGNKKKKAFMESYSRIMNGIANGEIDSRSAGLDWNDKSGKLKNTDDGFDADGAVLNFLDSKLNAMSSYVDPKTEELSFTPTAFNEYFINNRFGGVKPTQAQMNAWDDLDEADENGVRGTTNRAKVLSDMITGYIDHIKSKNYNFKDSAFESQENYIAKLLEAQKKLQDGVDSDDIRNFSQLGIDLNDFLGSEQNKSEEESKEDEEERKEKEKYDAFVNHMNQNYGDIDFDPQIINAKFNLIDNMDRNSTIYNMFTKNYLKDITNSLSEIQKFGNYLQMRKKGDPMSKQIGLYRVLLDNEIDNGNFDNYQNDDGTFYIPGSASTEDHSGWVYNPVTHQLVKRNISKIQYLRRKYSNDYFTKYDPYKEDSLNSIWMNKQGGTLKLQEGGELPYKTLMIALRKRAYDDKNIKAKYTNYNKKYNDAIKKAKLDAYRQEYLKTPGDRVPTEDFEAQDLLRMSSMAADIVSMISAWVPGAGTAVSLGSGIGSTVATFAADVAEDGLDWGDVGTGLLNLGSDLLGAIPVIGSSFKTGKIVKQLVKHGSKILNWMLYLGTGKDVINATTMIINKATTGEDLTVDDWKTLGNALSGLANVSRVKAGQHKAKQINKEALANTEKTVRLKTKEGKVVELSGDELKKFKDGELDISNLKNKNVIEGGNISDTDEIATNSWATKWFRGKYNKKNLEIIDNPNASQIDPKWFKGGKWSDAYLMGYRRTAPQVLPQTPQTTSQTTPQITPGNGPTNKQINVYKTAASTRAAGKPRDYALGEYKNQRELDLGIEFDKNGGILKAQAGVKFTENAGAWKNTVGKSTWEKILEKLDQDREYYRTINAMQDNHHSIYSRAGNDWENIAFKDDTDDTKKYQQMYDDDDWNNIAIAPNWSRYNISRNATSGDNGSKQWTKDNLYSAITDDRRLLGRLDDYTDEDILNMNNQLKSRNLEVYKDPETNYYKIRELNNPQLEQENPEQESPEQEIIGSKAKGKDPGETFLEKTNAFIKGLNTSEIANDLIPSLSLAESLRTNRENYDTLNSAIRPKLQNTYNLQGRVLGDLGSRNYYNNLATRLERSLSKANSSDATLNTLSALRGFDKAYEYRIKGLMADNEKINKTSEQAKLYQDDNTKRYSDMANVNLAEMYDKLEAKSKLKAMFNQSNHQSWDTYLKELYNKNSNNILQRKEFDLQRAISELKTPDQYDEVIAAKNAIINNKDPKQSNALQMAYENAIRNANNKYQKNYYDTYQKIKFSKSGGSLEGAKIQQKYDAMITRTRQKDNERFDKNMRHYYSEYMKQQRALAADISKTLNRKHKK